MVLHLCSDHIGPRLQESEIEVGGPTTGEVHVWSVRLEASQSIATLLAGLSHDEQDRARRYVRDQSRQHFVLGRYALRLILSRYTGTSADRCQFATGPHGKPSLYGQPATGGLEFNMSHSEGLALVGVTRGAAVGVDIECNRDDVNVAAVSRTVFSDGELSSLMKLPEERRPPAFFQLWTRKEAFLKCLGLGLGSRIEPVSITLGPTVHHFDCGRHSDLLGRNWCLADLTGTPGFAAAVVVEGDAMLVRRGEWSMVPP